MHILVAEDSPEVVEMYRIALESRGHTVTVSFNGSECVDAYRRAANRLKSKQIQLAANSPYDVVLLDYRMPKVEGVEAAKEILRINPLQRIMFVSAFLKEALMDSVKVLGQPVELIEKPVEPRVLVKMIESDLAISRLQELKQFVQGLDKDMLSDSQIEQVLKLLKDIQDSSASDHA